MDRIKIFEIAQRRTLSKVNDTALEVSAGTRVTQGAALTGSFAELAEGSNRKLVSTSLLDPSKESLTICPSLRDEDTEVSKDPPVEIILLDPENKGSNLQGERMVEMQEGFSGGQSGGGEGASENCTYLRFQTKEGWLGEGSGTIAPDGALEAFFLSPNKQNLDKKQDEELLKKFGTYCSIVAERVREYREIAVLEHNRAVQKEKANDEALTELTKLKEANESWEMEKQELNSALSKAKEEHRAEKAVLLDRHRIETSRLQKELLAKDGVVKQFADALKKAHKDASVMEEKAGTFHENGFNDCLGFVGIGNIVDDKIHTIERYRAKEIAKAKKHEKAKAEAEAQQQGKEKANIGAEVAEAGGIPEGIRAGDLGGGQS